MITIGNLGLQLETKEFYFMSFGLGEIIPHMFNYSGSLTVAQLPDSEYIVSCDGQAITDAESVFNGTNVPDLNNFYTLLGIESSNISETNTKINVGSYKHRHPYGFNTNTQPDHVHNQPSWGDGPFDNPGYTKGYWEDLVATINVNLGFTTSWSASDQPHSHTFTWSSDNSGNSRGYVIPKGVYTKYYIRIK